MLTWVNNNHCFSIHFAVAKVKLTNTTVVEGKVAHVARVLQNYTLSCEVPKLLIGEEVILQTDLTPNCPCPKSSVELGKDYVVGGHYEPRNQVWHLRTSKGSKGCILGKWRPQKYNARLQGFVDAAKPNLDCWFYYSGLQSPMVVHLHVTFRMTVLDDTVSLNHFVECLVQPYLLPSDPIATYYWFFLYYYYDSDATTLLLFWYSWCVLHSKDYIYTSAKSVLVWNMCSEYMCTSW